MNTFNTEIFPVSCHTNHIGPGSIFVAIQGQKENGLDYIAQAVAQGAAAIVVSDNATLNPTVSALLQKKSIRIWRVAQPRRALAQLSAQASNYAHKKLSLIGITGTKGKTTCAFLIFHTLRGAGYRCALLSTVYNKIETVEYPSYLTTPQPDYLHQFFHACVAQGVTHVVMELAAQAFSLHRTEGLQFCAGLFTNFSKEHGEFYATEQEYFQAKTRLINQLKPESPFIINADDPSCSALLRLYPRAITYGLHDNKSMVQATCKSESPLSVEIDYDNDNIKYRVECATLKGHFNAYNATAATALLHALQIPQDFIEKGMATFPSVPGRMEEHILPNGARAIIDYAHNPSSYRCVLPVLKSMASRLIVLFGCGGERDREKRPIMGHIASIYADYIIITSDNPRSESVDHIIQDIIAGIEKTYPPEHIFCYHDRSAAIAHAYALSDSHSIIALLGKGPDEYQIIGKEKIFFSERAILQKFS